MKAILFCNLPYAFSILEPLAKELLTQKEEIIWYIPKELEDIFPYKDMPYTTKIKDLKHYKSDVVFVPGNDVPHFIQGIKVQIFHGLAGEKKGHFRIRDYFDLYLTQGPYFTQRFTKLSKKHKNFRVKETGWSKLDPLFSSSGKTVQKKEQLLKQYNVKSIVLYSPTFSPSLTSAQKLLKMITDISQNDDILVIIKFHDKMDLNVIKLYQSIRSKNLIISKEKDILPLLQIADIMISDTSSVVYEFILLNKPVITLNSTSENIHWANCDNSQQVEKELYKILNLEDDYKKERETIISLYHPYTDGKSSQRMISAIREYMVEYGIPKKRALPLLRKLKMLKKYFFNKG